MKTAIQELIDNLTNEIEDRNSVQATNKMYHTSTRIAQEILDFYVKPLLEKEKNIMFHSFYAGNGYDESLGDSEIIFEEYYNENYNQNK